MKGSAHPGRPSVGRSRAKVATTIAFACLLFSFWAVTAPVSAHPDEDLGGNVDISVGTGIEANGTATLAQSFRLDGAVSLFRVSLYLRDLAPDGPATVAIHASVGGVPGTTALVSESIDSGPDFGWVDITFDPIVAIAAGTSYWIVLSASGGPGTGCEWWNSEYDAHDWGAGMQFLSAWAPLSGDFVFTLFGHEESTAEASLTSSADVAIPGRQVDFRVGLTVAGPHPLARLWLNVTHTSNALFNADEVALTNLSVTRTTSTTSVRYDFTDVPVSTFLFTIRLSVLTSARAGETVDVGSSVAYLGTTGLVFAGANGSLTYFVRRIDVTVAAEALEAWAMPGTTVRQRVNLVTGPSNVVLNIVTTTVRAVQNLSFVSANRSGEVTGSQVRWTVPALGKDSALDFRVNGTLASGLDPAARAVVHVLVTYEDANGTLRLLETDLTTRAAVPRIFATVTSSDATVREGDRIRFRVDAWNTGTGPAEDAWINGTLDDRLSYAGEQVSAGAVSFSGRSLSWHVPGFPVGNASFSIDLDVLSPYLLPDGDRIPFAPEVEYTDGLGRRMPSPALAPGEVEVLAPLVTVSISLNATDVRHGGTVQQEIILQNAGRDGSNRVRISQNLGAYLQYVSSDSVTTPALADRVLSWDFHRVGPGTTIAFNATFLVLNPEPLGASLPVSVTVEYSDWNGLTSEFVASERQTLTVGPGPSAPIPVIDNAYFAPLLLSVLGVGTVLTIRHTVGTQRVSDLFLVRRDGILIVHRSQRATSTDDPEVFSAMFTAIQDFVRDSFRYQDDRQLKGFSFGEMRAEVSRGDLTFLAVMYRGSAGVAFRRRIRRIREAIEMSHGAFLRNWDGDRSSTEDLSGMLDPLLRERVRTRHRGDSPH